MASRRPSWAIKAALTAVLVVVFATTYCSGSGNVQTPATNQEADDFGTKEKVQHDSADDVAEEAQEGSDTWTGWATHRAADLAKSTKDMAYGTGQYASEKANIIKGVTGTASDATDKACEYKNTAAETAQNIKDLTSEKAEYIKNVASPTASETTEAAKKKAEEMGKKQEEVSEAADAKAGETVGRGRDEEL